MRRLTVVLVFAFVLVVTAIFARLISVWRVGAEVTARIESLNGAVGVSGLLSGPVELHFSVEGLEPLVGDEHLEELVPLLRRMKIQYVALTNTSITDRGLKAIVDGCGQNLRVIELSGTMISDDSLKSLTTCPNLRLVSIPLAALRRNGVSYLASMMSLTEVAVYGSIPDNELVILLQKTIGDRVAIQSHKQAHFLEGYQ
jgi:hypothetical protein